MKVDIAGVLVDNITKQEALEKILQICKSEGYGYFVTPYSEMVVFADKDENYRHVLNNAVLSLPDGIGILWAAKFISLPITDHFFLFCQLVFSLIYSLVSVSYVHSVIRERIVGSHLIWDIARLAAENNLSISLVGGSGGVAEQTAGKLKAKSEKLKINLVLSDCDFNDALVEKIAHSNSDILLIAFSPPQQEMWIAQNLQRLNVRLVGGLGGTFDYVAGKKLPAPKIMHYMGLEWLWRLITQPYRIKRIWRAVPVFIWKVYSYKVHKVKSL